MSVKMFPVESRNLHSVGYDEANQILHVRFGKWDNKTDPEKPVFVPAKLYTYAAVPPEKFSALIDTNAKVLEAQAAGKSPEQSVGAHFTAEIKNAGYDFQKVDESLPA